MGFFHVPFQDAPCRPWKCSSAIPEASWSQQGQNLHIQGHGGAGRVHKPQQSQDGKMGLEESQGLKGVTCNNLSHQAGGRSKEEKK